MRKRIAAVVGGLGIAAALVVPASGGAQTGLVTCTLTSTTGVTQTVQVAPAAAQQINGKTITISGVTLSVSCG